MRSVRGRALPPILQGSVASVWLYDGQERSRERILPLGTAQLLVDLDGQGHWRNGETMQGPLVVGPTSRPANIERREGRLLGVVFTSTGLRSFAEAPARAAADRGVALADLGVRDAEAWADLAEATDPVAAAIARLAACGRPADPGLPDLVAQVGRRSVSAVARTAGLSGAQLRELFAEHVGLSPKRWSRVRRVQRALTLLRSTDDLARIARRGGWFDHAHFTRDFRAITGVTPSTWRAWVGEWDNHLPA